MDSENYIKRYPSSSNKSLKAYSAADELLLHHFASTISPGANTAVINDRFGFLFIHLQPYSPSVYNHYKSQEEAIEFNLKLNGVEITPVFKSLFSPTDQRVDAVVMKIPKSMDLFHLFLAKSHLLSKDSSKVFCGFMTRHFTKRMLELASLYFENTVQSKAVKKARVLILSSPRKDVPNLDMLHKVKYINSRNESKDFVQYYGVFSAKHIDYATDFLLRHFSFQTKPNRILDLASGNGVIAYEMRQRYPDSEIHLMDDSYLAIESSKLNLLHGNNHFHCECNMDHFPDQFFDLVISNPPFHFEHENTIEIALTLFSGVARTLKDNGTFMLVANRHLNYRSHLDRLFQSVKIVHQNSKFEIISCEKVIAQS